MAFKYGNLTIGTFELADGSVTTVKLANTAVTAPKVDTGAITEAKVATDAITTDKIAALAVTNAKIDNVSADKLIAGSVAVTEQITSDNYVADTAGWAIDGDGNAEFNDVTVRGTIVGSSISATSFRSDAEFDTEYIILDDGDIKFYDGGDKIVAELELEAAQDGLTIKSYDAAGSGLESFLQLINGDAAGTTPTALFNDGARPVGIYQRANSQRLDLRATGTGSNVSIEAVGDNINLNADTITLDADSITWREPLLKGAELTLSVNAGSEQVITAADNMRLVSTDADIELFHGANQFGTLRGSTPSSGDFQILAEGQLALHSGTDLILDTDADNDIYIRADGTSGGSVAIIAASGDIFLSNNGTGEIGLRSDGTDSHKTQVRLMTHASTADNARVRIRSANNGAYRKIEATDFVVSSDSERKRDIANIPAADRAALATLRAKQFRRIDPDDENMPLEYGFLAQDLPPTIVNESDGLVFSVTGMLALMWEEIRVLRERVPVR